MSLPKSWWCHNMRNFSACMKMKSVSNCTGSRVLSQTLSRAQSGTLYHFISTVTFVVHPTHMAVCLIATNFRLNLFQQRCPVHLISLSLYACALQLVCCSMISRKPRRRLGYGCTKYIVAFGKLRAQQKETTSSSERTSNRHCRPRS